MDEYFIEEKSTYDKFLDFIVFIAVFVVTIFLILDVLIAAGKVSIDLIKLQQIYFYVDTVVFIIFSLDLVRLWKESTDAKEFFANNWLDVLATIPFGLFVYTPSFEILKLTKFSKLSKLSKLEKIQKASKISKVSKEFKAAGHMKKESEEYQKKHRL